MDDEPATEILAATYRALCDHGYADLTLKDIAAEADKSKATIHYHYDSKDELFAVFLDYLYDRFSRNVDAVAGDTPRERLQSLLDSLLADEPANTELRTAMLEVAAQAPYNDAVQTQLATFDDHLSTRIRDLVAAGIDAGEFDEDVDPERIGEFLTTTVSGAHTRQVAYGNATDTLHETVSEYVETELTTGDTTAVVY